MPYRFLFKYFDDNGEEHIFDALLESHQCGYTDRRPDAVRGRYKCGRKVIVGFEFCFQHLCKEKHLRIRTSTIPGAGKGLFCQLAVQPSRNRDVVFRKGDLICEYNGEIISKTVLHERYGHFTAPYTVQKGRNYIDASISRGVGSLSNHSSTNYNAILRQDGNKVYLEAVKNIVNNDEIICHYGNSFAFNEPVITKTYLSNKKNV